MAEPTVRFTDAHGYTRVITIAAYDDKRGYSDLMWVYTRPSYDPVYHLRAKGQTLSLCFKDVTYWQPSLAYTGAKLPKVFCQFCHRQGYNQMVLEALAE